MPEDNKKESATGPSDDEGFLSVGKKRSTAAARKDKEEVKYPERDSPHTCSNCSAALPVLKAYKPRNITCPFCGEVTTVNLYYELLKASSFETAEMKGEKEVSKEDTSETKEAGTVEAKVSKRVTKGREKREAGVSTPGTTIKRREGRKKIQRLQTEEGLEEKVGLRITFPVLFRKALLEFTTPKKTIILIIFLVFLPFILGTSGLSQGNVPLNKYPAQYQGLAASDTFLAFAFFWTLGLPLALAAAAIASSFVSDETSEGTLLTLVSRPIERWEIIGTKFASYVVYMMSVLSLALVLAMALMTTTAGLHPSVFSRLLSLFPPLLIYGAFVIIIFGGIPTALSCYVEKSSKAMVSSVALYVLIYVGFILIRVFAGEMIGAYYLYFGDIGYHLSNVYVSILEGWGYRPSIIFQQTISTIAGTYEVNTFTIQQYNQGFILPTLPLKGYTTTWQSLGILGFIFIGALAGAIRTLQKKEIN